MKKSLILIGNNEFTKLCKLVTTNFGEQMLVYLNITKQHIINEIKLKYDFTQVNLNLILMLQRANHNVEILIIHYY